MLTIEKEKRFALLASIDDVGGRPTKATALDNIQERGYLQLNNHDLAIMPNRNEPFWRNDMAYVRKHLVQNRTLSGVAFNRWEITEQGRQYLSALAFEVASASAATVRILTPRGLERAMHHKR